MNCRGDAVRAPTILESMQNKPKFDPQKHHRRSIRLQGYDYSQAGAYYVTIVTYHRDCLFGEIINKQMSLNNLGQIADECWGAIPEHFPFMELGAFVVMPNHAWDYCDTQRGDPMGRPYHTWQSSQGPETKFIRRNNWFL